MYLTEAMHTEQSGYDLNHGGAHQSCLKITPKRVFSEKMVPEFAMKQILNPRIVLRREI